MTSFTCARVGLLFLFFACLALTGCLSVSGPEGAPGSNPGEGNGGVGEEDEPVPVRKRAYYMLHASDLNGPDWPPEEEYDVFVCAAGLGDTHLDRVREAFPDAICLAGVSAQDAVIGIRNGNPYWDAFTAAFDSTHCIRNLDTGEVVRIWSPDPGNPDAIAVPTFVLRQESADVLAEFHRDVTMQTNWDGLYVDMCTSEFPLHRKRRLEDLAARYDIDDDGFSDTLADVDRNYGTWRPYFTQRLREVVGEDRVILGNSAGALIDGALNGITLEKVGEKHTYAEARTYFRNHAESAFDPPLSVAWIFSSHHEVASDRVASEHEFVIVGDIVP